MRPTPPRFPLSTLVILVLGLPASGQAVRPPVVAPAPAAGQKLDLNTATLAELEELPGIGPAHAGAIVKARPFKAVDDLKAVKGITSKTFAELEGRVHVVTAPAPAPRPVAATPGAEKPSAAVEGKVDLNTATLAQLEELPGIGPVRAGAIVKARPFKAVDDLKSVKGISPKAFAELEGRVHVAGSPALRPEATLKPEATPKPATAPAAPATPKGATPRGSKSTLAPGQKVNLNSATREELDALPGIGPVRAEQIIKARPFATIEDVMKIKGIKQVEFGKIKDMITVK